MDENGHIIIKIKKHHSNLISISKPLIGYVFEYYMFKINICIASNIWAFISSVVPGERSA